MEKGITYEKGGFLTRKKALQYEAEMKTKLQVPIFAATVKTPHKQTVKDYLDEWVESYARVNLLPPPITGTSEPFTTTLCPYIDHVIPSMIDKTFQKILESLEMPQIRFYDLRHSYVKPTTKNCCFIFSFTFSI